MITRLFSSSLCLVVLLTLWGSSPAATGACPDLKGSDRALWGHSSARAPGVANARAVGPVRLIISEQGDVTLTDSSGVAIHGSYVQSGNGCGDIEVTEGALKAFLLDGLPSQVTRQIESLEVSRVVSRLRAVETPRMISISYLLRFRVMLGFRDANNRLRTIPISNTIMARGQDLAGETKLAETEHALAGRELMVAGRSRINNRDASIELVFGPDQSEGLSEHQFALESEHGRIVTGTYVRSGARLQFHLSDSQSASAASYLQSLASANAPEFDMFSVSRVDARFVGLARGDRIMVRGRLRYRASVSSGGDQQTVRGNYVLAVRSN